MPNAQQPFRVFVLTVFCAFLTCAQTAAPVALTPNQPVEKNLSGGVTQSYQITASAGQFLRLTVEQRGIDLSLALFAPDNKSIAEVDFFHEGRAEQIVCLTETAGIYRLDITPVEKNAPRGVAQVTLQELRAATELDRQTAAAQQAFLAAEELAQTNKPDARRQAISSYNQALQTWRTQPEKAFVALALYALAENYRGLNQSAEAVKFYQQALAEWRALKDQREEAATLSNLAATYATSNQPAQAIEHYQQAIALFDALAEREDQAAALTSIGKVYTDQGDAKKALPLLTQARDLRRQQNNRLAEAIALTNLGEAHRQLGDKREALKNFQAALSLRRVANNVAGITNSLNSLCAVYLDLGEMQQALDACAQSVARQKQPVSLNNLGRAYDLLGAPQEALQNYEQALQLARAATAPAARLAEARTLNFMGLAHWAAGDFSKAVEHFNQSLEMSRTAKNATTEAAAYNNLGLVYNAVGDWQKAIDTLNQALPLMRASGNRQYQAYALNNLGFAYEGLRDTERAFDAHNQALKLAREVRDRQREAKIHFGLARLERTRNNLKEARQHIEATIEIVEAARAKLTDTSRRAEYRAATQQYYDLYLDVLMRMHKRAPRERHNFTALNVSERARARSLLELLTEANADLRADAAPELVERERALQDQLNDKLTEELTALINANTATQAAAIAKELEQLTQELRDVRNQLRTSSPRYAALTQPQPLTAEEIQKQILTPDTVLLEYALGEEQSYLWLVTPTSLRSYALPKRSELEPLAQRFYTAVTNRQTEATELRAAGMALSKVLLAPVASQLGNKRLLIVADGALQYIPFAALSEQVLRKKMNQPATFSNQPLVVRHEINYLPSASTLAVLRNEARDKPEAKRELSVLADPVFEAQDERIKTVEVKAKPADPKETSRGLIKKTLQKSGVASASLTIPRLPFTRDEAEAILALAPESSRQSYFDFSANRAAATSDELGQARIIHFATHGFLNSLNPELSGLVLTLVNEKGEAQDGYLLAPELYSLKLPATQLAVLSACQTGLGKEVRGEGLIGLTRGLMYAGVQRVVVSLWSVNDKATSELMKAFYQGVLTRKQSPSASLRAAQLALWRQRLWRSPYYWAAFTAQGEWR